jgi:hypothetical protein
VIDGNWLIPELKQKDFLVIRRATDPHWRKVHNKRRGGCKSVCEAFGGQRRARI